MRILSWNIQYGRGVDGRIDLPRICDRIVGFGDPDVICLQEVAAGFDRIDGGVDQVARLARLFPAYQVLYRPGLEWLDGPRPRRFGNLMLSRLPVYELQSHPLPRPPDPKHRHMPRHLLQILVAAPAGPLRIATTHLEYFSALQRDAQVARIVELEAEWSGGDDAPPLAGNDSYASRPVAIGTVWCGDFNFASDDPNYRRIQQGAARLVDAWTRVAPGQPHPPTCGVHDRIQWVQGPHTRDFFFVSERIASKVTAVEVDVDVDYSDHQPVLLTLSP
ncbi:MAG TPA: endonuclease/exonuclease/phosphatase family protein [Burkholderiaceae bacterium]|nr:endonuclease/exonuclease/phosphatase family protein [Burkholderiaceae bacterium]